MRALFLSVLCGFTVVAQAVVAAAIQFDIPAQPVSTALLMFSQQAGVQVTAPGAMAQAVKTQGVQGQYDKSAALTILLKGTGLSYRFVDDESVVVTGKNATANGGGSREEAIQVAQNELASGGAKAPDGAQATGDNLEEVVVTGSRLRYGGPITPSPVVVFDRARLDELGVSSLPDVLKYSTQQPYTTATAITFDGAQFAQFRGLPVEGTAVLINGHRVSFSPNNASNNGFDINMIPLAAIDRVELLTGSASAVYGADAVGGVMNVILKKDLTGPTVEAHYGSAQGGAQERRFSLTAGHSSGRLRANFFADYYSTDPLFGAERDRWSNQDWRRFGGTDNRIEQGNPGAVISTDGSNLPGLSSPYALTRPGSTGVGLTAADFIAVPTEANLARTSLQRFAAITYPQDRRSVGGFAEFDLTDKLTVFAEGLYAYSKVIPYGLPFAESLTVPSDNPFNPFGVDVTVPYLFAGLGVDRNDIHEDLFTVTAGVRGKIVGSWDWELSGSEGKSIARDIQSENSVDTDQADCLLTNPATRATGDCKGITEALNVFQDGPGGSAALLNSLRADPFSGTAVSKITQATGFVRGSLFSFPGGAVDVVLGASHAKEELNEVHFLFGDRTNSAAFAEMRIPIVSAEMGIRAIHDLSLSLAGREDHYSDFGSTFNPRYGLVWSPLASLSMTASYGTSFSAPPLFRLFRPRTARHNFPVLDPRRNEVEFIDLISGGNRNLQPEDGESFTAGLVFVPTQLPRLRLSAQYWSVTLDNRISGFIYTQILPNEALFPERVVRAAPDVSGLPGRILSIDQSAVNFARLATRGVDLSASYAMDTRWGRVSPSLSTTWTQRYKTQDLPGIPEQDRVGLALADGSGSIPRWKAVGTLAWSKGAVGVSTTMRYVSGFDDTSPVGGLYVSNGRRLAAMTLFDLQGTVDLDRLLASKSAVFGGTKISAGASNLFNRQPPFVDFFGYGYDYTQGDLIGRFMYVNLSKRF